MTDETTAAPGPGHNITPYDEITTRTDELIATANRWLAERPEIADDGQAGKANDFLTQLRAEFKAADKQRTAEKAPHTAAGKAVDERYRLVKAKLELAVNAIKAKLTVWLKKQQDIEDAARLQREETARKEQEEADRLAAEAADKPTIEGQIEAEEARKRAEAAEKDAARPVRAQAKGEIGRAATLRTVYRGEIENIEFCLAHYRNDTRLREALQKIVDADIRAGDHNIPGVKIRQEQKAA